MDYDDGEIYEAMYADNTETTCSFAITGTLYSRQFNWEEDISKCGAVKVRCYANSLLSRTRKPVEANSTSTKSVQPVLIYNGVERKAQNRKIL